MKETVGPHWNLKMGNLFLVTAYDCQKFVEMSGPTTIWAFPFAGFWVWNSAISNVLIKVIRHIDLKLSRSGPHQSINDFLGCEKLKKNLQETKATKRLILSKKNLCWESSFLGEFLVLSTTQVVLLLMEEVLHHLGYINLVNNGINYRSLNWLTGFHPSTVWIKKI